MYVCDLKEFFFFFLNISFLSEIGHRLTMSHFRRIDYHLEDKRSIKYNICMGIRHLYHHTINNMAKNINNGLYDNKKPTNRLCSNVFL